MGECDVRPVCQSSAQGDGCIETGIAQRVV